METGNKRCTFKEDKMKEENPCIELAKKMFKKWGYPSNKSCVVKGCTTMPARVEPGLNYTACISHFELSPLSIQKLWKSQ